MTPRVIGLVAVGNFTQLAVFQLAVRPDILELQAAQQADSFDFAEIFDVTNRADAEQSLIDRHETFAQTCWRRC